MIRSLLLTEIDNFALNEIISIGKNVEYGRIIVERHVVECVCVRSQLLQKICFVMFYQPYMQIEGNFFEHVSLTDCNDLGIVGFLSSFTMQICRFYCVEAFTNPTFLAPREGKGMEGSREIWG